MIFTRNFVLSVMNTLRAQGFKVKLGERFDNRVFLKLENPHDENIFVCLRNSPDHPDVVSVNLVTRRGIVDYNCVLTSFNPGDQIHLENFLSQNKLEIYKDMPKNVEMINHHFEYDYIPAALGKVIDDHKMEVSEIIVHGVSYQINFSDAFLPSHSFTQKLLIIRDALDPSMLFADYILINNKTSTVTSKVLFSFHLREYKSVPERVKSYLQGNHGVFHNKVKIF